MHSRFGFVKTMYNNTMRSRSFWSRLWIYFWAFSLEPILHVSVTSSETRSVCVKQALNTRHWLVNVLVTWHVSYKITTLHYFIFCKLERHFSKPQRACWPWKHTNFWDTTSKTFLSKCDMYLFLGSSFWRGHKGYELS